MPVWTSYVTEVLFQGQDQEELLMRVRDGSILGLDWLFFKEGGIQLPGEEAGRGSRKSLGP